MGDRSTSSGVGRAVRRIAVLGIVGAAGFGGWVAYERFIAEDAAAETVTADDEVASTAGSSDAVPPAGSYPVAAAPRPDADPPWPASVTIPGERWASFRTSYQPQADVIRQQIDFDPMTNRARMTMFDAEGVEVVFVEANGEEVWAIETGGAWQQPEPALAEPMAQTAFGNSRPRTLHELFPAATWPHTTLLDDVQLGDPELLGSRRLTFSIDTAGFSLASPVAAADWGRSNTVAVDAGSVTWAVDLDDAGHIVRFDRGDESTASVTWYSELTTPIPFTSPLGS